MNKNKNYDCIDSLLFAAAKNLGEKDIVEYNDAETDIILDKSFAEKIVAGSDVDKNTSKTAVRKGSIGFKRFAAIVAAACFAVILFTLGGTAGKKQLSAKVDVLNINDNYVLTYDTNGIRSTGTDFTQRFPSEYKFEKQTSDSSGTVEIYSKDGVVFRFCTRKLSKDYRCSMGSADSTEYFEFLVDGKYNGCVITSDTKDGTSASAVLWNDGEHAFELYGNCGTDIVCIAAQSLYR